MQTTSTLVVAPSFSGLERERVGTQERGLENTGRGAKKREKQRRGQWEDRNGWTPEVVFTGKCSEKGLT